MALQGSRTMHLLTLGTQTPKKFINLISEHKINQNFRQNSVFEFYQISARLEHKKTLHFVNMARFARFVGTFSSDFSQNALVFGV